MKIAVAGEAARIIMGLKRLMKARAITYKDLAARINLSEVSIKRIFSQSSLSLARLEQICEALGVSIQEIARLSGEQAADATESVSLEQEAALAADPNLFACYYLIANGRTGVEICKELGVEEIKVRRWMVKLHSFGLVELRSKMRARARTGSAITWRQDGPMWRLYEDKVRQEYLQSTFSTRFEAMHFRSAEMSDASCLVLLRKLERLATEFRDLAELDRSLPAREKRSMGLLLAVRPWVFSMFESLRRGSGER
ncbi:MAG TPA: helix-turn-helix transcriptional regulator [Steroidobacteraceae bacterium]|nr:helix-turn-helix transcriptional regulator [Steroidobacteraceae bacterium]